MLMFSCKTITYVPYQGIELIELSKSVESTKEFMVDDVANGLMTVETARNYYNLFSVFSEELKKEHNKARKKVLEYKLKQK